ncbi:hypothetical protein J6590_096938 [Homalodisca vitripennis]|nr:hypothetical protein J6590_096938 [Homalodisca vitripennis]
MGVWSPWTPLLATTFLARADERTSYDVHVVVKGALTPNETRLDPLLDLQQWRE